MVPVVTPETGCERRHFYVQAEDNVNGKRRNALNGLHLISCLNRFDGLALAVQIHDDL